MFTKDLKALLPANAVIKSEHSDGVYNKVRVDFGSSEARQNFINSVTLEDIAWERTMSSCLTFDVPEPFDGVSW